MFMEFYKRVNKNMSIRLTPEIIETFNINALIFTLGMMAILQSLAMVVSNMKSIQMLTDELYWFGTAKFLKMSLLVWIFLILIIIYWIILRFTKVGRRIYAIGGNPTISNLFGIKVKKIKINPYL